MRIEILRVVRHYYLHFRNRIAGFSIGIVNSYQNIAALQDLSLHRFSDKDKVDTVELSVPVSWPYLDISIVTYNNGKWVASFIDSLEAQDYPLAKVHLRFVDHGSKDDTVQQVEQFIGERGCRFASVNLIRQPNIGFGAGHDRAIREGSSGYCLVTNLDLEFTSQSLCEAMRAALNDVECRVASFELRQMPYEHPKYYDPVTLETNWSSHACILIRRDAYLNVGGYDPAIFMYAEDVELSYRFRSYGYVLKYVPKAIVRHHTYEHAGEVKPRQFSGSILGNAYVRLRYGNFIDRFMALFLYLSRIAYPSPFKGAKKLLIANAWKLTRNVPHFLQGKGPSPAFFPFRGFDYELVRDGAFWQVQPAQTVTPLVTIVTRTYHDRGVLLEQAMQSVFNQTYPAIELIVVEDGGDTQREMILALSERAPESCRVRFLASDKIGRSGVGNVAMAAAQGHYMMFLDDDDLLFADHVETLVGRLQQDPTLAAAYSLSFEVQTEMAPDKSTYVEFSFLTPRIFRQEWNYDTLKDHNFIPIQSILFKKSLFDQRGGFDLALDQLEDWNLWLRYGFKNQFAYVPKTTSLFRTPADSAMRAARHEMLHKAYYLARDRAEESIAQRSGHAATK